MSITKYKTSMQLPDDCKIVLILDKRLADSLGRLLKWAIKRTQMGEFEAKQLPYVSHLDSINDELQNGSYAVEDGAWLQDALISLERGQKDLEDEL